jgi:hypothetical protein
VLLCKSHHLEHMVGREVVVQPEGVLKRVSVPPPMHPRLHRQIAQHPKAAVLVTLCLAHCIHLTAEQPCPLFVLPAGQCVDPDKAVVIRLMLRARIDGERHDVQCVVSHAMSFLRGTLAPRW